MMHPSMEQFRDFAARQPANRTYNWVDSSVCACAQYARQIGEPNWTGYADGSVRSGFWNIANGLAHVLPHTFGALTQRLDAYLMGERSDELCLFLMPNPD